MTKLNYRCNTALIFLFSGILMATAGCSSQVTHLDGSGQTKRETRELDSFDTIKVEGIGFVTINYGQPTSCTVITDDNLVEHYKTSVKDNVLTLAPTASIRPSKNVRVVLNCDLLNRLEVGGAAQVKLSGFYGSDLAVVTDGSCSVAAAGKVTHLELSADGGCEIRMFGLKAKTINAVLRDASSANLYAEETLTADVQGAASITYDGKAKVVKTQEGVAAIRRRR